MDSTINTSRGHSPRTASANTRGSTNNQSLNKESYWDTKDSNGVAFTEACLASLKNRLGIKPSKTHHTATKKPPVTRERNQNIAQANASELVFTFFRGCLT